MPEMTTGVWPRISGRVYSDEYCVAFVVQSATIMHFVLYITRNCQHNSKSIERMFSCQFLPKKDDY